MIKPTQPQLRKGTKVLNNKCNTDDIKFQITQDTQIELDILRKEIESAYKLLFTSPEKYYHYFHVHIVDYAETFFPPPISFPIAGLLALQLCEVIFLHHKKSKEKENKTQEVSNDVPRKIEATEFDGLQNLAGYIVHKQLKAANKPKGPNIVIQNIYKSL